MRLRQDHGEVRARPFAAMAIMFVLLTLAVSGCAAGPTADGPASEPLTPAASAPASSVVTASDEAQLCLECGTGKKPAMVRGDAEIVDGIQVVRIAIEGGTYVPNDISVEAGRQVRVIFTGKARGCLAKPTFKSLSKSCDVTGKDSATIELGTLPAGDHVFTCGMGVNAGKIVAR